MDELYRKLLAQLEEGQDTVLAFITEGDGSIPRTTGAYMLVGREGRVFGTIGGGNLEYQAVLHAQELVPWVLYMVDIFLLTMMYI